MNISIADLNTFSGKTMQCSNKGKTMVLTGLQPARVISKKKWLLICATMVSYFLATILPCYPLCRNFLHPSGDQAQAKAKLAE